MAALQLLSNTELDARRGDQQCMCLGAQCTSRPSCVQRLFTTDCWAPRTNRKQAAEAGAESERDDAALFARLAELERAEEAAEVAGHSDGGGGGASADHFMPATPTQRPQGAAAASHPRLSQLSGLQQAGAPVQQVISHGPGVSGAAGLGFRGPVPTVQERLLGQQQSQQQQQQQLSGQEAAEQQASPIMEAADRQAGEGGLAAAGGDDGGVGAVGSRLRRVSWADEKSSAGVEGGASGEPRVIRARIPPLEAVTSRPDSCPMARNCEGRPSPGILMGTI